MHFRALVLASLLISHHAFAQDNCPLKYAAIGEHRANRAMKASDHISSDEAEALQHRIKIYRHAGEGTEEIHPTDEEAKQLSKILLDEKVSMPTFIQRFEQIRKVLNIDNTADVTTVLKMARENGHDPLKLAEELKQIRGFKVIEGKDPTGIDLHMKIRSPDLEQSIALWNLSRRMVWDQNKLATEFGKASYWGRTQVKHEGGGKEAFASLESVMEKLRASAIPVDPESRGLRRLGNPEGLTPEQGRLRQQVMIAEGREGSAQLATAGTSTRRGNTSKVKALVAEQEDEWKADPEGMRKKGEAWDNSPERQAQVNRASANKVATQRLKEKAGNAFEEVHTLAERAGWSPMNTNLAYSLVSEKLGTKNSAEILSVLKAAAKYEVSPNKLGTSVVELRKMRTIVSKGERPGGVNYQSPNTGQALAMWEIARAKKWNQDRLQKEFGKLGTVDLNRERYLPIDDLIMLMRRLN
jgi:hypothetical protein